MGKKIFETTPNKPMKSNIAPEKRWLEDHAPFGKRTVQGLISIAFYESTTSTVVVFFKSLKTHWVFPYA